MNENFNNILKAEIDIIVWIQNNSFKYEPFLSTLSHVLGSSFFYAFIIPLFAAFNTKIYNKLIVTAVASDFLNLIIKWFLVEDRPYWWVSITDVYTPLTRPILYQTEKTCETSPGSPSGHLTFASAVFYILLLESEDCIKIHFKKFSTLLRYILKALFVIVLALLTISRMYFATHFLHQCLFGVLIGISITKYLVYDNQINEIPKMDKFFWVFTWCFMLIFVLMLYWIPKMVNVDPMYTVKLAFEYCLDPFHPRPETTVMFGCIRCLALVIGFTIYAPLDKNMASDKKLKYSHSIPMTLMIMCMRWITIYYTPKHLKLLVFYSYTIASYCIFQFGFLYLIPRFCMENIKPIKSKEN